MLGSLGRRHRHRSLSDCPMQYGRLLVDYPPMPARELFRERAVHGSGQAVRRIRVLATPDFELCR